MNYLVLVNFAFVLLFGEALTLSFAGIRFRQARRQYFTTYLMLLALQIAVFFLFGEDELFKLYPLVIHLPLFLILVLRYKSSVLMAMISVLSAYLFCIPRKWCGTLAASFFGGSPEVSLAVQIAVTVPLLLLVTGAVSPHMRKLRLESRQVQLFFVAISLMYYVYDYVITVYSNLMYRGSAAMAEWMSTLIVIMYFVFYIRYIEIVSRQSELQLEKLAYEVSAKHAEKEIDKYRQAQDRLAVYRHDMHHHLQYISNCIAGGDTEKAQQYIRSISEQIGSAAVRRYCSCEALDLLLSAYIDRAESLGIRCDVAVQAGSSTSLPETDLCSLFANVFENAINANAALSDDMEKYISVSVHTKNGKLCICISNPCTEEIIFENGLPKTGEDGHGFGAKSIQRVVDKSGGVCRFRAENGVFEFTAVL